MAEHRPPLRRTARILSEDRLGVGLEVPLPADVNPAVLADEHRQAVRHHLGFEKTRIPRLRDPASVAEYTRRWPGSADGRDQPAVDVSRRQQAPPERIAGHSFPLL